MLFSSIIRTFWRPRHLCHICKYCREDLPSAEKKRDHQRGCASRKKPDMIKPSK